MLTFNRALFNTLVQAKDLFKVVLVTGPRNSGKKSLLKAIFQDKKSSTLNYVSLEDPEERYFAIHDPSGFIKKHKPPLLIAEIEYAPVLWSYIKMAVANSDKMGQFFLTSTIDCKHLSSQIELSFNGSLGVFTLLNLSNSEIYGTKAQSFNTDTNSLIKRLKDCKNQTVIDIFERIVKGSCPENLNQTKDFDNTCYYQAYVNAYLQREIRFFLKVKDELLFYRFLKLVATYSAKPVIIDELAIKAEISTATAKRWLNNLVATHLIALVPSFNTQKLKGKNKASYLYFLDTALWCFLLKLQDPISLLDGPMANAVFETYVFSEIYKSCINQGIEPIFSYFKTKRQSSATLLIYQEDCIHPIQIKLTASPFRDYKDKSNFLASIEDLKKLCEHSNSKINIAQGAVICMCEDVLPIDHKNNFVPVWLI